MGAVETGTAHSAGKQMVFRFGNPFEGTLVRCKRIEDPNLEQDLHKFVERHLYELFRLKLVTSEFRLVDNRASPRPDTLAFDETKNCFVVIEYKKGERKDGPVQLTTYASAKNNEETKRKMLEISNKTDLKVIDVNWDAYYCIYIGFNISESLIANTSALSTDIRMYEITAYDGIVVLRRVGMNKYSKDDGLDELGGTPEPIIDPLGGTPEPIIDPLGGTPEPIIDPLGGGVPIADLDPDTTQKHLPSALQFPDGTSEEKLRGWGTVLRKVAVWLYRNGHIKDTSKSQLLNTHKAHNSEELQANLYVKLNFTAQDALSQTKNFLDDINYRPRDFKITLRPRPSGG